MIAPEWQVAAETHIKDAAARPNQGSKENGLELLTKPISKWVLVPRIYL